MELWIQMYIHAEYSLCMSTELEKRIVAVISIKSPSLLHLRHFAPVLYCTVLNVHTQDVLVS